MAPSIDDTLNLLWARRQVSLRRLRAPGPDDAGLRQILEAAAQAPDHGLLRPWRFILIPWHRREDLGKVFVNALVLREPDCGDEVKTKARDKAFNAPCLLVAILDDDPASSAIPTAEKLVSLGCAIQNMLIAAEALHFASGLASGGALDTPGIRQLLGLEPHQRAICFVGFGTASAPFARRRPQAIEFFSTL